MTGAVRHLLDRDGRYFARLVIPRDLRPFLGKKTELRLALGADRRIALAKLPGAVASHQHRIAIAERDASRATGKAIEPGRYPMSNKMMALRNYMNRLAFDEELRNVGTLYSSISIDDRLVAKLPD